MPLSEENDKLLLDLSVQKIKIIKEVIITMPPVVTQVEAARSKIAEAINILTAASGEVPKGVQSFKINNLAFQMKELNGEFDKVIVFFNG